MKQEQKSLITKTKIIDTSIKLFTEKGYNKTTMQDILSQSGLSKGAVYHHFRSKKDILEYAMAAELQHITGYLKELSELQEVSATEKLDNLIDFFVKNDTMKGLTKSNWAEKIPYGLLYTVRNTTNVLSHYLEKIIRQGNEQGEFDCMFPFETASVLLLLLDIWLDPVVVKNHFSEIAKKIDYISFFLKSNNIPVLTEEKCSEIKHSIKSFYND